MASYKDMYLKMVDATETALQILIRAQRDAEELYISTSDPDIRVLSPVENYAA